MFYVHIHSIYNIHSIYHTMRRIKILLMNKRKTLFCDISSDELLIPHPLQATTQPCVARAALRHRAFTHSHSYLPSLRPFRPLSSLPSLPFPPFTPPLSSTSIPSIPSLPNLQIFIIIIKLMKMPSLRFVTFYKETFFKI